MENLDFGKLDKKLIKDIQQYCNVNSMDVVKYINDILKKGFNLDRFGDRPPFLKPKDKKSTFVKEEKSEEDKIEEKKPEIQENIISQQEEKEDVVISDDNEIKLKVKKTKKRKLS